MRPARLARATAVALPLLGLPSAAPAQEAGRAGGCTLVMEPRGATESVSLRVSDEEDAYITHVWGGMRWTCGTATMTADSAVRYDLERRVEMFGAVRYRDTIRTLESDRLDFYEDDDRMVALGDVLLTRLGSGSTLRGPHVTFLRAASGANQRTVATGRPHMILLPKPGQEGKPVDVDADRVDLIGERVAWAWGEVVIERPDVHAEADSAFFDVDEGNGILYGTARAEQEDLELEGDTIHLLFTEEELEQVRALGSGRAVGEQFEIRSEEIQARLLANELDHLWAFGAGRSLAASAPYVLAADSLRFAATAGQLDSIFAVGQGSAVEVETADLSAGEPTRSTDGGNWVVGDTLILVFEQPASTTEPAPAPPDSAEQTIEQLLALGDARSFYTIVRDPDQAGAPSRNYLIGTNIRVDFREGKAQRVSADQAIGIYMEPGEGGVGTAGPPAGQLQEEEPADDTADGDVEKPPDGGDRGEDEEPEDSGSRPARPGDGGSGGR